MRATTTTPLLLLAACSSVWNEPRVLVSPYLAVQRLRGGTSLQAPGATPGDPAVDTAAQRLADFGQDHYREDVGVRADIGDGFGGMRLDYLRLDMGATQGVPLGDAWGSIPAGDDARLDAAMDEFRLSWVEPVLQQKLTVREHPLVLRLAGGGAVSWRSLDLRGRGDGSSQDLDTDGSLAYGALRARAEYRGVGLDVELGLSPGLVLDGDHEGMHHDVEVRGSYALPWRDVTVFAGWRHANLRFEGDEGGLAYRTDLVLDGFQFGLSLTL